jgi:hypothetical protein
LPDGSEAGDAARWLARHEAEAVLAAAEAAVAEGLPVRARTMHLVLLPLQPLGCRCCCRFSLPLKHNKLLPRCTALLYCHPKPLQGSAKRLRAAERQLDAVLEAALEGGDGLDAPDDFDALEEGAAPPPPPPAGEASN